MLMIRPYQRQAIDAAKESLSDNPVVVLPTGGGKTFSAAALVRETGLRTLWLAERRELIDQATASLRSLGLDVGIILAGRPAYPNRPVQVASVQTLVRRDFPPSQLLVIDECHHASGRRMQDLLSAYKDVPRVGLTATPFRLDGKPLGDTFGRLIVAAYPDDLVEAGVLVAPKVYAPPPIDVAGISIRAGEFERKNVFKAASKPKLVGDVVHTWRTHADGMRTALFAVNVEHSRKLIDAFTAAGVPAEHVDGKTPAAQRSAAVRRLSRRETLVLSNCQVFTEGWDLPELECASIVRPTASLCLHIQIVGRIMRACAGKDGALVLDHAGNFLRHGTVTRRLEYSLVRSMPTPAAESTGTGLGMGGGQREIPTTVEGQLQEFDAHSDQRERESFFEEMKSTARARGYRPGWAAWRYRDRYGVFPQDREVISA